MTPRGAERQGVERQDVEQRLRLFQLSDSALPIGGYTHSWGLEAAISRRLVRDAATLERWARAWLKDGIGPLEGVLVGAACRAGRDGDRAAIARCNELLTATLAPPSIRAASHEMGETLLALGATWSWSAEAVRGFNEALGPAGARPRWNHAIAFGLMGSAAGASSLETVLAYLHQAALGIIGAGVRAVPVGHTHGQQVLAYLHDDLARLAADLDRRGPETAGGGSPFYEMLCHEQTRLYARMFRS